MARTYQFSDEDLDLARNLARLRNGNKERNGVRSRKKDDSQGEEEIHKVGLMGEIAAARVLDTRVNQSIDKSGDDGFDVEIGPLTAEIKTRQGEEKDYAMYDASSDIEADIGILCWITEKNAVDVVGWITKSEWKLLAEGLRFGRTIRRGVAWENMRDIATLEKLVTKHKQNQ